MRLLSPDGVLSLSQSRVRCCLMIPGKRMMDLKGGSKKEYCFIGFLGLYLRECAELCLGGLKRPRSGLKLIRPYGVVL